MVFHDFRGNIWRRSLMLLKYVVGVKYVLIRTTLTRFIMGAAIFNTSSWHFGNDRNLGKHLFICMVGK